MENKSLNVRYCSLLQVVDFYNLSEIESASPAPFWDYVTNCCRVFTIVMLLYLSHLQLLHCKCVKDGLPKGSVLEPLLFLIDINYLSRGLKPGVNILLVNGISLFSVVSYAKTSALKLNSDLRDFTKLCFFLTHQRTKLQLEF